MTEPEVIEAAREAGIMLPEAITAHKPHEQIFADALFESQKRSVIRFTALIAAKQREKDARICEALEDDMGHGRAQQCANAIRGQE